MYFDKYTTNWYQNWNLSAREINLCQISTSYSVFGACVFDDLHEVAAYMNDTFGVPVTGDKARLNSRKTIVTPSLEHVLSEYKSLKGMRENYCYLIQPNYSWGYFHRYTCTTCMKCKDLDFLHCVNPSRGRWKKTKIELKWNFLFYRQKCLSSALF